MLRKILFGLGLICVFASPSHAILDDLVWGWLVMQHHACHTCHGCYCPDGNPWGEGDWGERIGQGEGNSRSFVIQGEDY